MKQLQMHLLYLRCEIQHHSINQKKKVNLRLHALDKKMRGYTKLVIEESMRLFPPAYL
jgi:hypothetical protein